MLDTGASRLVPTKALHHMVFRAKVGNHLKYWIPVLTENPGFRQEFIPMKIGAGMTTFMDMVGLWTGTN